MRRIPLLAIALSLAVGFMVGSSGDPAEAHTASNYYVKSWPNGHTVTMGIGAYSGYVPSTSTAVLATDLIWAGNVWDAVPNASNWGQFEHNTIVVSSSVLYTTNACSMPSTADLWLVEATSGQIGSDANGSTAVCASSTTISAARVSMRKNPPGTEEWYFPPFKPPGSATARVHQSFVGTLVHEFGHVTGFGVGSATDHFVEGSLVCDDSPKASSDQTMCPGPPEDHYNWYSTTLGTHDAAHTFAAWY